MAALRYGRFVSWAQMFALLRSHRRPVPSRVAEIGIGEWGNVLWIQTCAAVVVTASLIALSTGQLDYYVCGEEGNGSDGTGSMADWTRTARMGPNFDCMHSGSRFVAGVSIEHFCFALLAFVWWMIPSLPKYSDASAALRRRDAMANETTDSAFDPLLGRRLRRAFNEIDQESKGFLDLQQTKKLLARVKREYALEGAGGLRQHDIVEITKAGKQQGNLGSVVEKDWNKLVKVAMKTGCSAGLTEAYRREDVKVLLDHPDGRRKYPQPSMKPRASGNRRASAVSAGLGDSAHRASLREPSLQSLLDLQCSFRVFNEVGTASDGTALARTETRSSSEASAPNATWDRAVNTFFGQLDVDRNAALSLQEIQHGLVWAKADPFLAGTLDFESVLGGGGEGGGGGCGGEGGGGGVATDGGGGGSLHALHGSSSRHRKLKAALAPVADADLGPAWSGKHRAAI